MKLTVFFLNSSARASFIDSLANIMLLPVTITRSCKMFLLCNINVYLSYFCDTIVINIPRQMLHARNVKQKATTMVGAGFLRHLVATRFFVFISLSTTRTLDNPNEKSTSPGSGRQITFTRLQSSSHVNTPAIVPFAYRK